MMKKDKNNQNINNIPKYLWGNYFKKPIKWLAHLINNYGNSKHPFITTGTSYAYAIGDEKRRHPELTELQIHEIVNSRIKQNRKKLGLPTDNNITPSLTAAGLALGSVYYPWLAVPDIIFDTAASIDEPSTSNNIHTIADFPETVAKFTPSKIDDYVAKGVLTLGNIDDAVSTSGRNMFSNFDKKSGKINNTTDKTSVRESTNIRYRKNGGLIRKMLTASGGPLRIKFTPEQIALFESQATRVPGMNVNSNSTVGEEAKKTGKASVRLTNRKNAEKAEEFNKRNEMKSRVPVGERSGEVIYETRETGPKVIGMSGTDPLLGTIFDLYVGGKGLSALGKTAKYFFKNNKALKGFNYNDLPTEKYTYNDKTGDWNITAPKKEWIQKGENELVPDYFVSPEEQLRLIASGLSPEEASEIMDVRWLNSIEAYPGKLRRLGKNIYGDAENIDGRAQIRYNNRKNIPASLNDAKTTLNTVFHELGGHGSSLNIGYGNLTIPKGMVDILRKIYKHNETLRPKLRPFYQAVKDGDLLKAKELLPTIKDNVLKGNNGEIDKKAILDLIKYMEENLEYSARAIGTNMSNHYGMPNGWNEVQLRKYFTDESVDNLLKNVWNYGVPVTTGGYTLYNLFNLPLQQLQYLKQGGKMDIIKLFKEGGKVRKMLTASGGPIELYNTLWVDNWRNRLTSPVVVAKQLEKLTSKIPIKYLGGSKDNARKEFWKQEPVLQHAVDSVASLYRINPESLKYRLDKEGFTDRLIQRRNDRIKIGALRFEPRGYELLNNPNYGLDGTQIGLDDAKTYIDSGKVKLINENWDERGPFKNEKGRMTYPVNPVTLNDGMGIVAAHLKYFRDEALLDFPNGSEYDLDRYANAYYNRGTYGGKKWVLAGAKGYNYRKKGGMLEFLKNGSGIHIKEKNKGKFTSYCGGKVTDECILKGKNSSNPAIRKRATFAANARKWKHLDGGIIRKMKTAAGGPIEKVPEVVITPDKNTKILGNNIRGIIKDPVLRNNFYKYILNSDEYRDVPYISDNEKILRFINLYKKSGNPKIHVISPHGRPYYIGGIPFMNDIYASTSYYDTGEDNANIVAELSHAYQYNNNYAKQLKLKPGITRELKQGINRIFNEDEAYDKVGNIEYDAHSIIEPAMHEYISGSTDNFEKYLKNFTNEVRNYPKYYSSGVDKFASYYKKGGIIKAEDGLSTSLLGLLPGVGTYLDYKEFEKNPNWKTGLSLGISALGDAAMLTGAGTLIKGISAANKARKILGTAGKAANVARLLVWNQASKLKRESDAVNSLTLMNAPTSKILERLASKNLVKKSYEEALKNDEAALKVYLTAANNPVLNFNSSQFTPLIYTNPGFHAGSLAIKHKSGGIIKAEEGTKTNWWSKIGEGINKGVNSKAGLYIAQGLLLGLGSIFGGNNSSNISNAAKGYIEMQELWLDENELRRLNSLLNSNIDPENPNAVEGVPKQVLYGKIYDIEQRNLKRKLKLEQEEMESLLNTLKSNLYLDMFSTALGMISNNSSSNKDTSSSNKNVSLNTSTTSNSYFDNYFNSKYKKFGTFNPDGSMNMLGGTFTINGGYKPNQPQLFNYQPLKLNV